MFAYVSPVFFTQRIMLNLLMFTTLIVISLILMTKTLLHTYLSILLAKPWLPFQVNGTFSSPSLIYISTDQAVRCILASYITKNNSLPLYLLTYLSTGSPRLLFETAGKQDFVSVPDTRNQTFFCKFVQWKL